jgi:hypothetical protein
LFVIGATRYGDNVLHFESETAVRPNVRVEAGPTANRQARVGENVQRTTDPGLVACRWASPRTRG